MRSASVTVQRVEDARGRRDWLAVPYRVFADDPVWVPPLSFVERQRISPKHNPFFATGSAAFFVAYQCGAPVGRISAQVNRAHLERHADATGQFGFFDCIDDLGVAQSLVEVAAAWLASHGMQRMIGPFNLTINQDAGLLISGFEAPPAILTSHARNWAGPLLEACGMMKATDLFAYRLRPDRVPATIERLARLGRNSDRIAVRTFDMRHYARDVELTFDIFNDAWSDNWGFVPFGPADITSIIAETRPIMRGKFGRILEIDGEPAAMIVVLPDLNRVIAPFAGRLLPLNWARLAHAVYADRWKSARIPLLGIRRAYRGSSLAPIVLAQLVAELIELGRGYGLDWIEFSWVLENNAAMVRLAELAAGKPCKTYRIYERAIAASARP